MSIVLLAAPDANVDGRATPHARVAACPALDTAVADAASPLANDASSSGSRQPLMLPSEHPLRTNAKLGGSSIEIVEIIIGRRL